MFTGNLCACFEIGDVIVLYCSDIAYITVHVTDVWVRISCFSVFDSKPFSWKRLISQNRDSGAECIQVHFNLYN